MLTVEVRLITIKLYVLTQAKSSTREFDMALQTGFEPVREYHTRFEIQWDQEGQSASWTLAGAAEPVRVDIIVVYSAC